jgi:hypothetical protein
MINTHLSANHFVASANGARNKDRFKSEMVDTGMIETMGCGTAERYTNQGTGLAAAAADYTPKCPLDGC